jgi:hypothetical protein
MQIQEILKTFDEWSGLMIPPLSAEERAEMLSNVRIGITAEILRNGSLDGFNAQSIAKGTKDRIKRQRAIASGTIKESSFQESTPELEAKLNAALKEFDSLLGPAVLDCGTF